MEEGDGSNIDLFQNIWSVMNRDDRAKFLKPYAERTPSVGYLKLADLIGMGFFRLIISFNIDVLLQKALERNDTKEPLELVGSPDFSYRIQNKRSLQTSRPTIFQPHGNIRQPASLNIDADDVCSYSTETEMFLSRSTGENVIVCGYAFNNFNVMRSFSTGGRSLWWVNPEEPPIAFESLQRKRNSVDCVVTDELGNFDRFFVRLYELLK